MLHTIISRQRCKLVCRGPFVFKLFSCFHSLSTFIRTFSMMKGKNWRRRNLQYPNPSRSLWLLKRKMQNVIQHFSFALSILWTDKRMHLLMKFSSFKWDVDFVISSNIWFLYLLLTIVKVGNCYPLILFSIFVLELVWKEKVQFAVALRSFYSQHLFVLLVFIWSIHNNTNNSIIVLEITELKLELAVFCRVDFDWSNIGIRRFDNW